MVYILLYFIYFLGHGAYFSTLSPYIISAYGENSTVIFFASQLGFPLGYFASGYISDKIGIIRPLLIITILIQTPLQFLIYSDLDLPYVMIAATGTRFFFAFNFQLITIAALEGGGMVKFGEFRAYGTVGFFLIHALLFFGENAGFGHINIGSDSAVFAGKTGCIFLFLSIIPASFIQKKRISGEKYYFMDAIKILKKPDIILFFILSFFFYFSYQVVDYYLGAYLKNAGGMRMVYAAWALAVILEIPFMPLSSRIFHFKKHNILFLISTITGTIRFAILSMDASGIPTISILFTQLLHGIHFTGYYMGSIFRIKNLFPGHLYGTGYGLYIIITASAGGMIGNLIMGKLFHPTRISEKIISTGTASHNFTEIFAISMLIHFVLFFCFIILPDIKDSVHNARHETNQT